MGKISGEQINSDKKVIFMFDSVNGWILAILSLGFLIFIHELGHFLIAKRCRIRVDKFSIGFGPQLIGFRRGETDYCVSLLPFGGFVKMSGENPDEQTGAPGEFASAPVGHRISVAVAGPVMNFLLGIILFSFVYFIGLDSDTVHLMEMLTGETVGKSGQVTQIGLVADDSPAKVGGIQPGDMIISIKGQKVENWQDFNTRILTSPGKKLEIVVSRDGQFKTLYVTPESHNRPGVGEVGRIKVSSRQEIMVESVAEDSAAAKAGIQTGDLIETINGEKIYHVPEFSSSIWQVSGWVGEAHREFYGKIKESQNSEISLGIKRGAETLTVNLPITWVVSAVVEGESEAEKAGIRSGDTLVSVNGKSIENFDLYSTLYGLAQANPNQAIETGLLRNGEQLAAMLMPQIVGDENQLDLRGLHWRVLISGLGFTAPPVKIPEYNPIAAVGKGIQTNWSIFRAVTKVLKRLVTRDVSPKFLSGPVGIVHITGQVVQIGFMSLLFFVGFISVNLGIVNLLPIPIADGGQILFFALEKLRGKPLSLRKQIIIQQISIVFIIGLFLYITWYDILRVFSV